MRPTPKKQLFLWCPIMMILGLVPWSGCSDGKLATYPVSGAVLVDGQPADGALVVFCPTTGTDELMKERPYATADAQGKYALSTFGSNDGAPAGEYKVVVQWPEQPKQSNDERVDSRPRQGPDRLKGKYFKLAESTLAATVAEQTNEIPPFELKSR